MGTSPPKTTGYVSGENPATVEANRVYQDALARLSQSLDTRKNRFFDPVWLAAAQGFGAPTQTGGFGESLGNAAKSISAAQELDLKQEQEIAQQRVAAAGKGIELQRMRANEANIADYLTRKQSGPIAGPGAGAVAGPSANKRLNTEERQNWDRVTAGLSSGPLSLQESADFKAVPKSETSAGFELSSATPRPNVGQPGALPAPAPVKQALQGALPVASVSEDDGGVQIMPANPNYMTVDEYVHLNRLSGKSLGELVKEGMEIERKNLEVKDSGTTNLRTGKFYASQSAPEEIQIYGEGYNGATFKVSKSVALKLYQLQRENNEAGYKALADSATGRTFGQSTSNGEQSGSQKSVQQLAIDAEEAKTRAGKLGERAAIKEADVEKNDITARGMNGSALRVLKSLSESANFFGIFARPGVISAAGNLLKQGIQTPGGTLNLAGFEDTIRALMPRVTQTDLDNVTKAAAELAEMELAYTKLFLSGDGPVTEGERKIVRLIPGTISNSPAVLRSRMELIKLRTQKDIDVTDAYRKWQDKNPGRSYFEFERKSDLYKDIKNNFESDLATMFNTLKSVPTSQRKKEVVAPPSGGNPKLEDAKKRLEDKLK